VISRLKKGGIKIGGDQPMMPLLLLLPGTNMTF
jgi:hypothetical protein